jgi:hypothetical protein
MKTLTALLGTAFVLFVSAAAMDTAPAAAHAAQAIHAQHQGHAADATCCGKGEGMCARNGKDAKGCCSKDTCKDCCKDGTCKEGCTCECCKDGGCCKQQGTDAANGQKAGCCKQDGQTGAEHKNGCCKPKTTPAKTPIIVPSH